jgi:D-aspartate ligase
VIPAETTPTVFVTEGSAKAALPIIESLARAGIRVEVGCSKRINSGFFSRHCHKRHLYPCPRSDTKGFQKWLIEFLRERSISVVIPVGHYGALATCQIQNEIRRHSRLLMPDLQTFLRAYAKIPTMRTAQSARVPIPETWFPSEVPGGIESILPQIPRWPVLVKPSVGVGARGIVLCHTPAELRKQYSAITAAHGESFVQDFVLPGGMQYKVDVLCDHQQQVVAGIVYGKTRMYPPDGGSSVLNFSVHRPDILELATRMLRELRWVGFCDFDFVVDPRDSVPKLMEINPRPPESFYMGPSVGMNFPILMYRLAAGEPVEPVLSYPPNRFLRFMAGDLMWFLRVSNHQRFNTWPSWFHFFGRDTAYQLFRATDWGPVIGYMLEAALGVLDTQTRRERLRLRQGAFPERAVY